MWERASSAHAPYQSNTRLTHIWNNTDTFPSVGNSADWQYVRTTANFQSNSPVPSISTDAIRCYERDAGKGAPSILNVTAGQTLNYNAKASISHPGPMAFYIAKVPTGQTAATWDGKGKVWSKIYQDYPTLGGSMTWPSQGMYFPPLLCFPCPLTPEIII